MSVFVQVLIGVASTVISAALLVAMRVLYRGLRSLEEIVRRVERLEAHTKAIRSRMRMLEGGHG